MESFRCRKQGWREGTLLWRVGQGSPQRGPWYRVGGAARCPEHGTFWNTISPVAELSLSHPPEQRGNHRITGDWTSFSTEGGEWFISGCLEPHPWPELISAWNQAEWGQHSPGKPGSRGRGPPRPGVPLVTGRCQEVKCRGWNATMHCENR